MANITKKEIVLVVKKSCNGLKEFQKLLDAMQQNQAIKNYMDSHDLEGRKIFNNDCYCIEFSGNETTVYLNARANIIAS